MAIKIADGVPEPLKYKTWILKVPIHCGGCAKKVKRVLQTVDGVFTISIDPQLHKVVVTGDVGSETLIKRLVRSGKQAELWPEKSEKKCNKSKKKKDGDTNKESKDGHDQDAGTDKAEETEKPDENKGTDDSKDSDDEGENSSSETEEKATEAKPASTVDGGGKKKKKKKKKKKGQQNANAEGGKDTLAGSQPHFDGPDSVSPVYAPLKSCPPDHIMEAFPHYAQVMYGVSHSAANPSIGASYYAASPMNYSFLYSHQVVPYPPSDLIKTYHDGGDDPYYDDDDEGGCSIMRHNIIICLAMYLRAPILSNCHAFYMVYIISRLLWYVRS